MISGLLFDYHDPCLHPDHPCLSSAPERIFAVCDILEKLGELKESVLILVVSIDFNVLSCFKSS